MKKFIVFFISMILAGALTGCSAPKEETVVSEPNLTQIRSICNLATLECYYHNVAKSTKTAGDGIAHLGEVDRTFWIEYTGIAKIGIDMSKVTMEMDGENITISIPNAQLMGISIEDDALTEESYIFSEDGLNKNKITAEDQTKAIEDAQKEMEESVKNNTTLLLNAQTRAKELIENYIEQLSRLSGVEYQISWVYQE